MSEIPFVKALGDELERKIAARRGRIRRRITLGALGFALVATSVAAASGVFSGSPEQLASTGVGCYDRAGNVTVLSAGAGTPIEACRRALGTKGPLVACAGEAVLVFPGRPGTCERLGFEPLPAEYASARNRVRKLERALAALEASADCIPLPEFAERAQGVLDRLGWTGWRVDVRGNLDRGPCGSALAFAGDGSESIEGSLTEEHRLVVTPSPSRSTIELLYRADSPAISLMDATGERCYTVAGVQELARRRLAEAGRPLTFTESSLIGGAEIADARGDRLEEGCAVIDDVRPTPDDRGLVVGIVR
jgi:hypothetical protein